MTDRRSFIGGTAAALAAANASPAGAQASVERPGTDPSLPSDVYASSRNRAPLITREMLTSDDSRKAYDDVMHGSTIAGMQGPAGIGLYGTKTRLAVAELNQTLRLKIGLDPVLSELVMMVAARESDSAFEWSAHERAARALGMADEVITVVRDRKPVTGLGAKEAAIITLGREGITQHKVSPQTFANAQRLFGTELLVNISLLMGNYIMTGLVLHVFNQQLPPGVSQTLPGGN
jgi:4-carboxymuconolactone decarboxylase